MMFNTVLVLFVTVLCENVQGVHRADRAKMFWECDKCHEIMGRVAYLLKGSPALKDRDSFVKEFQSLVANDCDDDKLCCTEKDACAGNIFNADVEKNNGEFSADTACIIQGDSFILDFFF